MVKRTFVTLFQQAKIVFSHHRHFTNFQKVLISSILVGVFLCLWRNLWMTLVAMTYTITLYGAFSLTKYLATRNQNIQSDQVLVLLENIVEFIHSLQALIFIPTEIPNIDKNNVPTVTVYPEAEETNNYDDITITTDDHSKLKPKEPDIKKENSDTDAKICSGTDQDLCKQLRYIQRKPHSSNNEIDELSPEIDKLIKLILQDFVASWVDLITQDRVILHESELLLQHIFHGLHGRMYKTDTLKVINVIILMFRDHLHNIRQAQMVFKAQRKRRKSSASTPQPEGSSPLRSQTFNKSVEDCFGAKVEFHPAIKGTDTEASYLKSVIELLLIQLLREDLLESKSLFCALKELLMFNVLQNVINLLCDSTFLHELIIKILSDNDPDIQMEVLQPAQEIVPAKLEEIPSEVELSDSVKEDCNEIDDDNHSEDVVFVNCDLEVDEEEVGSGVGIKWQEDTEIHTVTKGLCMECNRLCSQDQNRISPRAHTCSLGTTVTFYDANMKDPDQLSINSMMSFTSIKSTESNASQSLIHGPEEAEAENDLQSENLDIPERKDVFIPVNEQAYKDENTQSTATVEEDNSCTSSRETLPLNSKSHPIFNLSPLPLPNPITSFSFFGRKQGDDKKKLSPSPTIETSNKHGKLKE